MSFDFAGALPTIVAGTAKRFDLAFETPPVTIQEFEELLWAHEPQLYSRLRVHRDGADLQLPRRSLGKDLLHWVALQFSEGATVVFNGLETIMPSVAMIARQFDEVFEGPTTANAFLTPPGCQGFPKHFDTHDIFVVQCAGRKTWRFSQQPIERPLPQQIRYVSVDEGEVDSQIEIVARDILYLPAGLVHQAHSGDAPSLHISFGVRPPKIVDAFRAMLDVVAEREASLRQPLVGMSSRELDVALTDGIGALAAANSDPYLQRLLRERMREHFVAQLRPIPGNRLASMLDAPGIDRSTMVTKQDGALSAFSERDGKVYLMFPGIGAVADRDIKPGRIEFPIIAGSVLRWIASCDTTFCAANLPGPLTTAAKTTIVRRLVKNGFLRVAR